MEEMHLTLPLEVINPELSPKLDVYTTLFFEARQRKGITKREARTLLRQPPIIIVDEPTVGLDPRERIRFRNLLSKLAEGRVILFSTHVVEQMLASRGQLHLHVEDYLSRLIGHGD